MHLVDPLLKFLDEGILLVDESPKAVGLGLEELCGELEAQHFGMKILDDLLAAVQQWNLLVFR